MNCPQSQVEERGLRAQAFCFLSVYVCVCPCTPICVLYSKIFYPLLFFLREQNKIQRKHKEQKKKKELNKKTVLCYTYMIINFWRIYNCWIMRSCKLAIVNLKKLNNLKYFKNTPLNTVFTFLFFIFLSGSGLTYPVQSPSNAFLMLMLLSSYSPLHSNLNSPLSWACLGLILLGKPSLKAWRPLMDPLILFRGHLFRKILFREHLRLLIKVFEIIHVTCWLPIPGTAPRYSLKNLMIDT